MEAPNNVSDGSLLQRFRNGSQEAATELHARYVERLRMLAKANLSPNLVRRLDPDDIVQSTFRCFFQAVSRGNYTLPSGEDLWSLLMVIALNRIRVQEGYHRAAKRDVRMTSGGDSFDLGARRRLKKDDASGVILRLVVRESLSQLPSHHQTVIQLRMEGYEVAEIARLVVRSKRTVERILQQALTQLRTLLEEEAAHDDAPDSTAMAGDR